jgi:hypothetical protein
MLIQSAKPGVSARTRYALHVAPAQREPFRGIMRDT